MASRNAGVDVDLNRELEAHRRELTGYCYRMLGSGFEAEDALTRDNGLSGVVQGHNAAY